MTTRADINFALDSVRGGTAEAIVAEAKAMIAALQAKIEDLEFANLILREQVAPDPTEIWFKLKLPLTPSEGRLMMVMLKRPLMTKQMALDALYMDRGGDWPDIKIIDVYICKIKKKLRRSERWSDIKIETVWGRGYCLSDYSKTLLEAYMDMGEKP